MTTLLRLLPLLILGILIGAFAGRWEVSGTDFPQVRASASRPVVAPATGQSRPKAVVVNGETHDFGMMEQNTKKSHAFVFRNDGNLPLTLEKISTTCKCTVSEVGSGLVEPGKTGNVTLEWEAKTGETEFSQSAEIRTNDPDRGTVRLVVYGKVRQAIHTDQREFVFNQVSANDEYTSHVRVYCFLEDDFKIESTELKEAASADQFEIKTTPLSAEDLKKEPGSKSGYDIAVTLKPGLSLGTLNQRLMLKHNLASQPPIVIPFAGKIASDIYLGGPKVQTDSNVVSLGDLEKGAGAELTIFVIVKGPHRDETTIQLTGVEPASSLQAVLGEPSRENPKIVRYPLTIRVPKSAEPGNFFGVGEDGRMGEIFFTTTHPHTPKFSVKVRFLIKDDVR
jgi:hypothetical protein